MSSKPTSGQLNFRIARHPFAIADWTLAKSPANATRLLESMPCAHASYAASAQQPHVRRLPTFPIRPTQGSRTITDVTLPARLTSVIVRDPCVGRIGKVGKRRTCGVVVQKQHMRRARMAYSRVVALRLLEIWQGSNPRLRTDDGLYGS